MRNVTVHITVEVGDQKYDYSGLFRKNFLLPAKDERQRIFDNIEEFKKHNITSDQILESPETTLTIGYEYTHYNKIVKVEKQQEYKWDENIGIWIIK
ncbi:hypothetical protein [Methylobacterium sp. Leaf399]|uniref:hypothetical protein n=1 Tax=Methylobacterium sp. Leaf399 TaxID=1736364 RepID=UPI001AEC2184|nr:hypothetical protein [Methylobacterium sp. Leaf399]